MILFDQLDEMLTLKENWDGHGAIPVFPQVIERTKDIFYYIGHFIVSKVSDIYPNPHGTITVEWDEFGEKINLEIGVNNVSFFSVSFWSVEKNVLLHDGAHNVETYQKIYDELLKMIDPTV